MAKQEKLSTSDSSDEIATSLINDFHDPDVREVYSDEFINMKIATQIKVLREQREWTQEQLALFAEMKQERVAVLENVNYESWTLNVLRRFAKAFDLVVDVEFKEFGEFLTVFEQFGREYLQKRPFKDDPAFKKNSSNVVSSDKFAKEKISNPVNRSSGAVTLPGILLEVKKPKNLPRSPIEDETDTPRTIPEDKTGVRFFKTA